MEFELLNLLLTIQESSEALILIDLNEVNKEFCLLYGEVAEAYDAWRKKKDDLNEELADIAIYLMGLSEMLGFDLEEEIEKKVSKNEKRVYKNIDGVNVRIGD